MTAEEKRERANGSKPRDAPPTGANVPLYGDFFGQIDRICRKWIDPEKDTCKTLLLQQHYSFFHIVVDGYIRSISDQVISHLTSSPADLHLLAVRPKFHRLGLGSSLIKDGLDIADAAGSKVYIIASPMGLPLYLRHGWKKVDEVVVDMRTYGGNSVVVEEMLIREIGAAP